MLIWRFAIYNKLAPMVGFPRILVYSVLATLGGLLVGCVLAGLSVGTYTVLSSGVLFSNFASGWSLGLFLAMFAVIYGLLPALAFGAPAYAVLVRFRRANYLTAALLGVTPGAALYGLRLDLAGLFMLFGVPVACCTHFFAKRCLPSQQMGANNSSKPTPLRGAA